MPKKTDHARFSARSLLSNNPESIRRDVELPRRQAYYPSPADWREVVLYFLLVDRFSDGDEANRPKVDRHNSAAGRGPDWRWDLWAKSGGDRFQGGTLKGVRSQLGYLKRLGVTTLWLSPVFKQRGHLDSYHGYGIQDFLDVDPRFGDRQDLIDLVAAAHAEGLRVILDIIFNHSGANWVYPGGEFMPPYKPPPDRYAFGAWIDSAGQAASLSTRDDGVWPTEFQDVDRYTRAGFGNLGAGDLEDPNAEHKRTDFLTLRDFRLSAPGCLSDLARCFKYWIALSDCDGFRIDTLKHVSFEEARNFCGSVKEYAATLGKSNFFLVGEIAGGDYAQDRYLDVLERNLNAALDIGSMRLALNGVAKGLVHPNAYFDGFDPGDARMGSHRHLGEKHVSILDDHDHVFGEKIRFASEAVSEHQVVAGVALQLFSLGIPCIYYGTEQALSGPPVEERRWLPEWKSSDRYLREALFGPSHPRRSGREGLVADATGVDTSLPGFGPFGTAGQHCFDEQSPSFIRITALIKLRQQFPALRLGRQYLRAISIFGSPFDIIGPGELVAWSRILDDEELLCVVNIHGRDARGANVIVDADLNPPGSRLTVVLNSAAVADPENFVGTHPVDSSLPVLRAADGTAYVELRNIPPSEVVVLANHA